MNVNMDMPNPYQLTVEQLIVLLQRAPQGAKVKIGGGEDWGQCSGVSYLEDGQFVHLRRDEEYDEECGNDGLYDAT